MKIFFENIKPGGQLLALAMIFVLLFILSSGIFMALTLFTGKMSDMLAMQAIIQIVSFGGTAVLFAYMFYGNPLRHLRVCRTERMPSRIIASLLILLLLLPMSDWLTRVNDAMHLPEALSGLEQTLRASGERSQELMETFLMRDSVGAFVANLIVLALVPALCEELLFRGALQQLVVRGLGGRHHWGIILTAAIFSLAHFELFAFLPRFLLGIALGYLFHYGGSLWLNATMHFANNAMSVTFYFCAANGMMSVESAESFNSPWYIGLVGLVFAVFVFKWVFLGSKTEKNDPENPILDESAQF